MEPIRLTQTIQKGGCAAKLPAGALRGLLNRLKSEAPPELLVGYDTMDDAAAWDLGDGRVLIQTLDFFTPIVDNPYDFGAIAAANSLSDVYAMGGRPTLALSILAFPTARLDLTLLEPLMEGANSILRESGTILAGGHSIDDETLKLGFSVSGLGDKENLWRNSGAQVGDVLVLTKPLGTGTISSALKLGQAPDEVLGPAVASMKRINSAPDLLKDLRIHAATDITGFGLAGHALQLAQASGVSLRLEISQFPVLPGALELLRRGFLNKAHRTNREYTQSAAEISPGIPELDRNILFDPQTSGGLLLALAPGNAPEALDRLRIRFPEACIIGEAVPRDSSNRLLIC